MGSPADDLVAALEVAIPRWVDRSVRRVLTAQGIDADNGVSERIDDAAEAALADGLPRLKTLLNTDIDEQRTNPLGIVRSLVQYPTEVLRECGAQPAQRDDFSRRNFPDDDFDLTPASFADLDESVHEPGLIWGASKAHEHLKRRKNR